MLWNRRNEIDDKDLPESLRGKTPEQIAEALKKAGDLETQFNQLKTDKDAADARLTTLTTESEQTKQRLAELEASRNTPPPRTDPNEPPEPPSIWSDPDKYIDNKTGETRNIALVSGIMSAKLYARQQLSARDAKIWRKYESDIDKAMEGYPPQQRILPQNWMMALTLVKGQHDLDIHKAEQDHSDFFAEDTRGDHKPPPSEPPTDKLSAEEEEACDTFHWDKKRYLDQKKKQTVRQSEKGSYANFGI